MNSENELMRLWQSQMACLCSLYMCPHHPVHSSSITQAIGHIHGLNKHLLRAGKAGTRLGCGWPASALSEGIDTLLMNLQRKPVRLRKMFGFFGVGLVWSRIQSTERRKVRTANEGWAASALIHSISVHV